MICFVSNFKNLKMLNIRANDIGRDKERESRAIANLNALTSLNISKNLFSNATIQDILQLTNLTSLDVSHNMISNHNIIKKLRELPKMQYFINDTQREEKNYYNFSPFIFFTPNIPPSQKAFYSL